MHDTLPHTPDLTKPEDAKDRVLGFNAHANGELTPLRPNYDGIPVVPDQLAEAKGAGAVIETYGREIPEATVREIGSLTLGDE